MEPSLLTVYESPYPKIRLGKEYDGGYVIVEIPDIHYSVLLSGGIEYDISFEEEFVANYAVKCFAFDGTIQRLPKENNSIEFVKKNIDYDTTDTTTNLHEYIESYDTIFIKMDIEGYEIDWLKGIDEEQLNKVEQIVIEFHHPFTAKEVDIFEKLNQTHFLVHFHGNNCCGTHTHRGVVFPNIFECTYLHKKYFKTLPGLNKEPIPSELDMRNLLQYPEICLNHPPFVNSS